MIAVVITPVVVVSHRKSLSLPVRALQIVRPQTLLLVVVVVEVLDLLAHKLLGVVVVERIVRQVD